jgi:phosphatidylinositol glycan class B
MSSHNQAMRQRHGGAKGSTVPISGNATQQKFGKSASLAILSSRTVVGAVLAWRLAGSLLQQSYFVPDEHWQGPEVAHNMIFGYGHITWEWRARLRGFVHPGLIALMFKAAEVVGADTPAIIAVIPKIFSALVAAGGDLATFALARRLFPAEPHVAACALLCQLLNLSYFFCMTRPLSNSLEAALTTAAFALWPHPLPAAATSLGERVGCFFLVAIAFAVRPTSALMFGALALLHSEPVSHDWRVQAMAALRLLSESAVGLAAGGAIMLCADRVGYGAWTLPPLNFVHFNALTGGAALYGTHPWYWYLSQALPILLTTAAPLALAGLQRAGPARRSLAGAAAVYLAAHSAIGHKEFRFLLPIVPLAMVYAGAALAAVPDARRLAGWATLLAMSNIPPALYVSLVHQRGAVDVVSHLSTLAAEREAAVLARGGAASPGDGMRVLFLTPCHATPFHAAMHRNISLSFLDCSPPGARPERPLDSECVSVEDAQRGPDEADRFYADPERFLRCSLGSSGESGGWIEWGASYLGFETLSHALPTHVVFFSGLLEQVLGPTASCPDPAIAPCGPAAERMWRAGQQGHAGRGRCARTGGNSAAGAWLHPPSTALPHALSGRVARLYHD